ncbi:MAG: LysE family transporter [Planctomycetota bacterium]|jgi:threonine/homoserine/homoserine lactone efflux protein
MNVPLFLLQVFVISFSGAMQPGPVTAAAIAIGGRNRYAGILLALGHVIVEFPLMILIMLGIGRVFELRAFQIVVGLAGGIVLLVMATTMFISLKAKESQQEENVRDRPVLAGIVLSASNPYFLLWWATIGLALATDAKGFGIWAFALFALVHWLCDCLWLQALTWASYKGSTVFGPRTQRIVLMICSVALLVFGLVFIFKAGRTLVKMF